MSMCFNDDTDYEPIVDVEAKRKLAIKEQVREYFDKDNYAKIEDVAVELGIYIQDATEAFNKLYKQIKRENK